MEFEWDPEKAVENLQKHGVEFSEASTIFGNPFEVTFPIRIIPRVKPGC